MSPYISRLMQRCVSVQVTCSLVFKVHKYFVRSSKLSRKVTFVISTQMYLIRISGITLAILTFFSLDRQIGW